MNTMSHDAVMAPRPRRRDAGPASHVLQRTAIDESRIDRVPPIVHTALRTREEPLDPAIHSMEPRLGHDFSDVRVHTGALTAAAMSVNALAERGLPMQRAVGIRDTAALRVPRRAWNDDPLEREADRIARKPLPERIEGQGWRRTAPSGGRLPEVERSFFEVRLGSDLGRVRLHHDEEAARRADVLSARAFTVGADIHLGRGEYAPETDAGRQLLAHELAHVVQQQGSAQALQCQEIPPELQQTPNYDDMSDAELEERYDRIVEVLAQFTTSTPDTSALEGTAAEIGVRLAHRRALAAGRTFDERAIERMRDYFKKNAKTEKDSCIVCLNKGMKLVTDVPTLATTPESIEKTMEKIAASGYSSQAREVWFQGKNGNITKGATRPEKLDESIWDTVLALSGGDPGWSVFTMSLLDGYHSVTLTLDANNPTRPRIYWSDQWQSKKGWKEYSRSSLDAEVVKLVKQWWDSQAEGKKHKTVVRLWRIRATKSQP